MPRASEITPRRTYAPTSPPRGCSRRSNSSPQSGRRCGAWRARVATRAPSATASGAGLTRPPARPVTNRPPWRFPHWHQRAASPIGFAAVRDRAAQQHHAIRREAEQSFLYGARKSHEVTLLTAASTPITAVRSTGFSQRPSRRQPNMPATRPPAKQSCHRGSPAASRSGRSSSRPAAASPQLRRLCGASVAHSRPAGEGGDPYARCPCGRRSHVTFHRPHRRNRALLGAHVFSDLWGALERQLALFSNPLFSFSLSRANRQRVVISDAFPPTSRARPESRRTTCRAGSSTRRSRLARPARRDRSPEKGKPAATTRAFPPYTGPPLSPILATSSGCQSHAGHVS